MLKSELRPLMKAKRKAVSDEIRAATSQTVCNRFLELPLYKNANTLAVYFALADELNPHPIIQAAWHDGKCATLPRVLENGLLSFWRYLPDSPLIQNRYGIFEVDPQHGEPIAPERHDIILIPLLAFDSNCNRIGLGAGYYDKTLAQFGKKHPTFCAIAYDFQCVKPFVTDSWDIKMDKIITENSVYTAN